MNRALALHRPHHTLGDEDVADDAVVVIDGARAPLQHHPRLRYPIRVAPVMRVPPTSAQAQAVLEATIAIDGDVVIQIQVDIHPNRPRHTVEAQEEVRVKTPKSQRSTSMFKKKTVNKMRIPSNRAKLVRILSAKRNALHPQKIHEIADIWNVKDNPVVSLTATVAMAVVQASPIERPVVVGMGKKRSRPAMGRGHLVRRTQIAIPRRPAFQRTKSHRVGPGVVLRLLLAAAVVGIVLAAVAAAQAANPLCHVAARRP